MCRSNVATCSALECASTPPRGPASSRCYNGVWYIDGSYTGGLIVTGNVQINGDLFVPSGAPFIFNGFGTSLLNVTGKATIRAGVTMVLTDADISLLKTAVRYSYTYRDLMVVSGSPSTSGSAILASANHKRACNRMISAISSSSGTYQISMRYYSTCSTWWIILVCVLPSLLVGIIAGVVPIIVA